MNEANFDRIQLLPLQTLLKSDRNQMLNRVTFFCHFSFSVVI